MNGTLAAPTAWQLLLAAGAACAGALAAPAVSHAVVDLTAIGVRIGDHPGFVRAVVDFTDGRLEVGEVMAEDPSPFADGAVRLRLDHRRVRTEARPARAHGVSVRLRQGTNRIAIRLAGARRRFKYVSYLVLRAPERLVIDLWKAAPPPPGRGGTRGTRPLPDRHTRRRRGPHGRRRWPRAEPVRALPRRPPARGDRARARRTSRDGRARPLAQPLPLPVRPPPGRHP